MTVDLTTEINWNRKELVWDVECSRCGHVAQAAIYSSAVHTSRSHLQWHINNEKQEGAR